MISRSRRKVLITTALASILISGLLGTTASAQESAQKKDPEFFNDPKWRAAPTEEGKRASASESDPVRQRSWEILQMTARERGIDPQQQNRMQSKLTSQEDFLEIDIEPPSREKLFSSLVTEEQLMRRIEKENRRKFPTNVFLQPTTEDRFNAPNSETMGPMWFQNGKSGAGKISLSRDRRGDMGIENEMGIHRAGSPSEASIHTLSLASPDQFISLQIELGNPQSSLGVIARAQPPRQDDIDQIAENTFVYCTASADTVTIGTRIRGRDRVVSTAKMAAKQKFTLALIAVGDLFVVFRDGQEVARTTIKDTAGGHVGIMALTNAGAPTRFEDFFAQRFSGVTKPRMFAESLLAYPDASVHYHPLYFEQITLERYGHHMGDLFQPVISQGEFFVDLFFLPYSMGKSAPWVMHSDEGYPKPGEYVMPFRYLPPVWDRNGILLQTGITSLGFSLIP